MPHGTHDGLDRSIDLGLGRGVTERQSQRAMSQRPFDTHGGENVRGFHGPTRARRRRRGTHPGFVEQIQQGFVLDSGETHVRHAGHRRLGGNRAMNVSDHRHTGDQTLTESLDPSVLGDPFAVGLEEGHGRGDDAGHVVRSAATITFLSATEQQRGDGRAVANGENSHSLRSSELVGTEGQSVDARPQSSQIYPAGRLNGIGVQDGARRETTHHARHRLEIGDDSGLVVDGHHRHDTHRIGALGRRIGQGSFENLEIDPPPSIGRNDDAVQMFDAVENGVMFGSRADGLPTTPFDGTTNRRVVALGSASGEHHVPRRATDGVGDQIASLVDHLTGATGESMGPGRIGELAGQERHHRRDRRLPHGGGGGVVEIDEGVALRARRDEVHHSTGYGEHVTVYWRRTESSAVPPAWWTDDVDDYEDQDYGDAIADVYDSWYGDLTDVDATTEFLSRFVSDGPVLELGIGTGRLAIPLADAGLNVVGIDVSDGMLERLRAKDPDGRVRTVLGDMVDDLPDGPFDLVFVAYNTFFNVRDADRQRRLLANVAERLTDDGVFVIEAFVPDVGRPGGDSITIRSMTTDAVVLRADRHDPLDQTIDGQLIEFTEAGGVRLRPYRIRYASPSELDDMAAGAGLVLTERWENTRRDAFDDESPSHVSVYRRSRSRILS